MQSSKHRTRTRAQESSSAIERLYIAMRHLFSRGFYKPMGVSGENLIDSLLVLRPEIYGSIAEEKIELKGLVYVVDRLPFGIEACQFINLTADEGYLKSSFTPIIPSKRRRNCYRIDATQMNIQITRGRSDIYDVLTHLTFLFVESQKLVGRILQKEGEVTTHSREWRSLEELVVQGHKITQKEREIAFIHLGSLLGRPFDEIAATHEAFATSEAPDRFFSFVYNLGNTAIQEATQGKQRLVTFSELLKEQVGHHIYGEIWADAIKQKLDEKQLLERPIHIISANMHSVLNSLYAADALKEERISENNYELFELLSSDENEHLRSKVKQYSKQKGLTFIKDQSGANIDVQLIDTAQVDLTNLVFSCKKCEKSKSPVLIVMDYAFGEQAYETMEELLKPIAEKQPPFFMDVQSISIMGKAGILEGQKGDIMIPKAHLFEGTADNYPFKNELSKKDLEGFGSEVYEGNMVTVLGTSLQNKDILKFFHDSTWNVIGLEMEGAHYQKAIQAASKVRGSIAQDVKVRYAYYASDNPLVTGSTLASGGLGSNGVRPTYAITQKIIEQIFNS